MIITTEMLLSGAGIITALGGAWLTMRKIAKDAKNTKEEEKAAILLEAKNDAIARENAVKALIVAQEKELASFKLTVEKDLDHLKETYNGEIKNLGQKIEYLREELRNQHGSLVELLTKLIDTKE